MSTRVDALEASIQDIINGDVVSVPESPAPGTPGGIRRGDNTLQWWTLRTAQASIIWKGMNWSPNLTRPMYWMYKLEKDLRTVNSQRLNTWLWQYYILRPHPIIIPSSIYGYQGESKPVTSRLFCGATDSGRPLCKNSTLLAHFLQVGINSFAPVMDGDLRWRIITFCTPFDSFESLLLTFRSILQFWQYFCLPCIWLLRI